MNQSKSSQLPKVMCVMCHVSKVMYVKIKIKKETVRSENRKDCRYFN